jgi:hypothetical protein
LSGRRYCYALDCGRGIRPGMLMCRACWFRVPKAIRDRVWRAYRAMDSEPGEYLAAILAARNSLPPGAEARS